MKVLLYMPFATWTPHFETDLEIAARHLAAGDEVHVVQCSGNLAYCDPNPNYIATICSYCKSRSNTGLDHVGIPRGKRHVIPIVREPVPHGPLGDIGDLMKVVVDGFPAGRAVASSLISHLREPAPDILRWAQRVETSLEVAAACHRAGRSMLRTISPDRLYLFNGRFAYLRAWLWAAQCLNLDVRVHERSSSTKRYLLIEGTSPHDLAYRKRTILEAWKDGTGGNRETLSHRWFDARHRGGQQGWKIYIRGQRRGFMPCDWNPQRRNVVIFNSSEDEFVALHDYSNPIYRNQREALDALLSSHVAPGIHFTLRVHPNLSWVWNSQVRHLASLQASNVTIVPPDSHVDTYSLLDAAEKVLTFGSTVGIEASYWGKPSILAGRAVYEDLVACYRPLSHMEVLDLVHAPLIPLPKLGAIMFGYWMATEGVPHERYSPISIYRGRFDGMVIRGSRLAFAAAAATRLVDKVRDLVRHLAHHTTL